MGDATVERTFCFIDLAGFTALTDAHGDTEAVALLDRFLEMTRCALGARGELVKSIGDAVMVATMAPPDAVEVVQGLLVRCQQAAAFPLPRAGAHHGQAISRDADYFGNAVNIAARVAARAAGGQFLATRAVGDAARQLGLDVTALGPQQLRNIAEPVDLFKVHALTGATDPTLDPVCRMSVDPVTAAGWLAYADQRHWFCSLKCAAIFAANPNPHLQHEDPKSR